MLEYKSANKDEMARAELFVLKDLNTKAVDAKQMLQRLIRSLGNLPSRSTHPNIKSKPYLQTIISLEQSRQYVQQHVDQFYMYLNQMLQILWRLEGFISNLFV